MAETERMTAYSGGVVVKRGRTKLHVIVGGHAMTRPQLEALKAAAAQQEDDWHCAGEISRWHASEPTRAILERLGLAATVAAYVREEREQARDERIREASDALAAGRWRDALDLLRRAARAEDDIEKRICAITEEGRALVGRLGSARMTSGRRRALPLYRSIRISADVAAWIERERRPDERANDTIRRMVGLPPAGEHRRPWRWRRKEVRPSADVRFVFSPFCGTRRDP